MVIPKVLRIGTVALLCVFFANFGRSQATIFSDGPLPSHLLIIPNGQPPVRDFLTCEILSCMDLLLDRMHGPRYPRATSVRLEGNGSYLSITYYNEFLALDATTGETISWEID